MNLEQRLSQGDKANEVLQNEQFQAAFEAIKQEILDQWINSPARDEAGREKLWIYQCLLEKVKAHLTSTLETGKLARIELQEKSRVQKMQEWMTS